MTATAENPREYNGYTNYETWCVHLWLANDPDDYRECLGKSAKELQEMVFEWKQDYVGEAGAGMFDDLLNAALCEVNWQEIAESINADD